MNDVSIFNPPELTVKQEAFCVAVVKWHGNISRAYREVYNCVNSSDNTIYSSSCVLAADPKISARIKELRKIAFGTVEDMVRNVVEKANAILNANPNDLIERRTGPCRYCWGADHKYQRTPREFKQVWQEYAQDLQAAIDGKYKLPLQPECGGPGYSLKRKPNHDCPECHGVGVGYEVVRDTRELSPGAAALYAGVERTKHGIKVNMQDQAAWAEKVMKYAGAYKEVHEHSGPSGGPVPVASVNINTNGTPEDVARAYAAMVKE